MIKLSSISRCFEGIVPASIATCSKDGIPNQAHLSQVQLIDERHVALSRQFFNKTTRNILENPQACVALWDPITFEVYLLDALYVRSETKGPLFDKMSARIDAIASHSGLTGVFRLMAAEVFEVLSVRHVTSHLAPPPPTPSASMMDLPALTAEPPETREELWALQRITLRMNEARDLGSLLSGLLDSLDEDFGFHHAQVLLLDETGKRLFTVASHGYEESGVGSEVVFGEGLIGTAARDRCILRVGRLEAEMRYGRNVRAESLRHDATSATRPEIPLAGLRDAQSVMSLPLLMQGRLVGVLALESRRPNQFELWHEAFLGVVANQVAVHIQRLSQADTHADDEPRPVVATRARPAAPSRAQSRRRRHLVFYQNDDCVFADGEYLIRNVPGRILWKILKAHAQEGRTELSNRELRLDPALGLPAVKDNLESRLILLRKRLEQKCPDIRLPSSGRGRFAIEVDCDLELSERPSA